MSRFQIKHYYRVHHMVFVNRIKFIGKMTEWRNLIFSFRFFLGFGAHHSPCMHFYVQISMVWYGIQCLPIKFCNKSWMHLCSTKMAIAVVAKSNACKYTQIDTELLIFSFEKWKKPNVAKQSSSNTSTIDRSIYVCIDWIEKHEMKWNAFF